MKKLFFFSSIYTGSSIFVKLFSFTTIILLGKYLSVEDYAIFAILFSIHQGIATFSIAGINESVIGFLKNVKSEQKRQALFSSAMTSSIIPSLLVLLLSFTFYFTILKNDNLVESFYIFIFAPLSGLLLSHFILKAHLYRLKENHFKSILYLFLPQPLIFLSGIIISFYLNDIRYFFCGSTISLIAFFFIVYFLESRKNSMLSFGSFSKNITLNSAPFFIMAILGWLSGYGNNFIINYFFSSTEIASFTFLYTFGGILLMIANSLNQVWAPRFYNLYSQKNEIILNKQNIFFYNILAIMLGVAVSLILIVLPGILKFLGGNLIIYSDMMFELFLLLVSFITISPIWRYRIYFYANSLGKELLYANLLGSFMGISSMIIIINFYESIGIYYGFLISRIIMLLIISIQAKKKMNININLNGLLVGTLISIITFLLIYLKYSIIYPILFILVIVSLIFYYINDKQIILKDFR